MKYIWFEIQNFKWIKKLYLDLRDWNLFSLVWLNESWKTTILESLYFFQFPNKFRSEKIIPKSKQANFNERILVRWILLMDYKDKEEINNFLANFNLKLDNGSNEIHYITAFKYKNSQKIKEYEWINNKWNYKNLNFVTKEGKKLDEERKKEILIKLYKFLKKESLLPEIIFYRDFSFDLPEKLYIDELSSWLKDLLQDILDTLSINDKNLWDLNLDIHLLKRIKSREEAHRASLEQLLSKISSLITKELKDTWGAIVWEQSFNFKVVLSYDFDIEKKRSFLKFQLETDSWERYNIADRSLWFRWFFFFILFLVFRVNRRSSKGELLYLLDEPASSNLYPRAQKKLLEILEELSRNAKIIYSTHSHYLINPMYLKNTFIIKNTAIDPSKIPSDTWDDISIEAIKYFHFVSNYPNQTEFFQPILEVLDFFPSELEKIPNVIMIEWKTDYYLLKYFNEIVFNGKYNINLLPLWGSFTASCPIELYLWWNRKFFILLDADSGWKWAFNKYLKEFWDIIKDKIMFLK